MYETPKTSLFDVQKYNKELEKISEERDINVDYHYNLIEIDGENKNAVFEHVETGDRKTLRYEMLHVTPPMGPLYVLKESTLSDIDGWVDIDPTTLQHKNFSNVFAFDDASNAPTSKTGAAIRKQAPTVVNNLLQVINSEMLTHHYDGYTSCPIVTGYNRLILAEFDYNKKQKKQCLLTRLKNKEVCIYSKRTYYLKCIGMAC